MLVAYHYSLATLLSTLTTDTPLAYLGLVPLIACGVALALARPEAGRSDRVDRHVDYMVGGPLMATAVLMNLVLPARMSVLFWYYRVDLLSLPLFVAGAVAVVFGTSTLYRIRYAIGFLVLAWPAPYNWALGHGMDSFTGLTLGVLRWLVGRVPVATALTGGDGSLFAVHHGGASFTLSVASACTGVDSFVGFLLVGLAVMTVTDGTRPGRLAWLATGMGLSFGLNLIRLMLIFWTGHRFGEKVALDGLHPVLGLILFTGGVVAMVAAMGRFGLQVRSAPVREAGRPPAEPWRVASRLGGATVALSVLAAVVGLADTGFARFSPVAGDLGAAQLVSFTDSPIVPAGWNVEPIAHYPWAGQYFGAGAVWTRFQFSPGLSRSGAPTILADVVNTSDLQSFSTYDVIACYDYHGYGLSDEKRVSVGDGVEATELTFTVPALQGTWNALYWVWPVRAGTSIHYERIVLLDPVTGGYYSTASAPSPSTRTLVGGTPRQASRAALVAFARQMVGQRATPTGQVAVAGASTP